MSSEALREAAQWLLDLKDGPRDEAYYATKDDAWQNLRAALAQPTAPDMRTKWIRDAAERLEGAGHFIDASALLTLASGIEHGLVVSAQPTALGVEQAWERFAADPRNAGATTPETVERFCFVAGYNAARHEPAPGAGEAVMEGWQSAREDAHEAASYYGNDPRVASRMKRVAAWLDAHPPAVVEDGRDADKAELDYWRTCYAKVMDMPDRVDGSTHRQRIRELRAAHPPAVVEDGRDAEDAARWRKLEELVVPQHEGYWYVHPGAECDRMKSALQLRQNIDAARATNKGEQK